MNYATDYPLLVFVLSFFVLWLSVQIGASFLKRQRKLQGKYVKTSALSWPLR